MRTALLDANMLLALAWPNHQHHAAAQRWFEVHANQGWATCAFTQLAFIRLSSNPSYTPNPVLPREAAALLQKWVEHAKHRYLQSPRANNPSLYILAVGHQQVNDAWLVEAARHNKGRVVTFDVRLRQHAEPASLVEIIEA